MIGAAKFISFGMPPHRLRKISLAKHLNSINNLLSFFLQLAVQFSIRFLIENIIRTNTFHALRHTLLHHFHQQSVSFVHTY
jgi:hypothetical protein